MLKPDYAAEGIVNLMASLELALQGQASPYNSCRVLHDCEALSTAKTVVLLVIDGLGFNFLQRQGGAMHDALLGRLTSVCPTTTAAAIPTFLTGAAPQQHGFTGWFTYLEEMQKVAAVLPYRDRFGEALMDTGLRPADLSGVEPLSMRIPHHCSSLMPAHIAHSTFNLSYSRGSEILSYYSMDDMFEQLAKLMLAPCESRHFVYAYWSRFDSLAHQYGVDSEQTIRHFHALDQHFQQLCQATTGSDSLLLATSDHGFVDIHEAGQIEMSAHPELGEMLAQPLCGEPRLRFCHVKPSCNEAFAAYVKTHMSTYCDLYSTESLFDQGFFGTGEPHVHFASRLGQWALVFKPDYVLNQWLENETPHYHIGHHGGLSGDELFVPLIKFRA